MDNNPAKLTAREIEHVINLWGDDDADQDDNALVIRDLLNGEDFGQWLINGEDCDIKSNALAHQYL